MRQQKGQVHIFILALLVIVFILYANFSNRSLLKPFFLSSPIKSNPKQEIKTSVPLGQEIKPAAEPILIPAVPVQTAPDTTPPKRFNPQPEDKSILPSETRKITLSIETDEKAICKYSDVSGVHFDSMQGVFFQTNGTSQSVSITTLSEGEKYKYYIKCMDEGGNKNTDDFIISFGVELPEDKTPPVLSNPSHRGDVLPAETKEVNISISTNELASCRYSVIGGLAYNSMRDNFSYYDQTKKFHTAKIAKLENGKNYDFFARCKDLNGNASAGDVLISFSVGI